MEKRKNIRNRSAQNFPCSNFHNEKMITAKTKHPYMDHISLVKNDKRSRRQSARGRKSLRLLAELLCPSKNGGAYFGLSHGCAECHDCVGEQCTPRSAMIVWDAPRTDQPPAGCSPVLGCGLCSTRQVAKAGLRCSMVFCGCEVRRE